MDDNNVVSKKQPFQQPLQLLVPPPKVLRVVNSSDVHVIILFAFCPVGSNYYFSFRPLLLVIVRLQAILEIM